VANGVISFLLMLAGSVVLNATVRPRSANLWRRRGIVPHLLVLTALFGLALALVGSALVAATLTIALMALLTITSNAKHAMLGEPLLFSDLALIASLVRHPRFYFTAVSNGQRWMLAIGLVIILPTLALLFVPRPAPHLVGLALLVMAGGVLAVLLGGPLRNTASTPDIEADLARHGLVATLFIYWLRWRATPDPAICSEPMVVQPEGGQLQQCLPPDLIVIVQCESFADPVELTGEHRHALSGLKRAQASAWQWGDLAVSGFGAYTMRTEYGVLFGRSEAALGFRRYDPFLTAHGETSYALPARLKGYGYRSLFVHPHDMRFYGRDRLMPAMGFDRLIGEESFASPPAHGGRYIDDQTLGSTMCDLVDGAVGPTLIYAVTMENHGPWDKDRLTGSPGGLDAYLRHLRSSDAMLTALIERLSSTGRSALLVFFGDHRPSIPGVIEPNGARHTPYVMLRFTEDGQIRNGANQLADLSPDELHHAILDCVRVSRPPNMAASSDA
jgi:phosphoglycerol transferase MdoB-like AlkP superfamily enzyme